MQQRPVKTLLVDLGSRAYEILVGAHLLDQLGTLLKPLLPGNQVAIVCNTTVAPLYRPQVEAALHSQGFSTLPILLPDGEAYKDWSHLQLIFDALIQNRFERSATLLALGGGVVGDMTGFAAATFLRGVPFVQIPTTLLSQVDASVGGKTGINHILGKNLIGAFYQPRLVMIDCETLKTLSQREVLAGLAEVIKYGIIRDGAFFQWLERNMAELVRLDQNFLIEAIHTCCSIKSQIVAADEREAGNRALLNLGHTFGHAIETLAGYGQILHGEAVAMGMVMAAHLSVQMGLCGAEEVLRIRALLQQAGLPVQAPRFPVEQYLEAMARDKKVVDGAIGFVLIERIGHGIMRRDVSLDQVKQTLLTHMEP